VQAGVIRTAVLAPYIRLRTVIGEFVKQKSLTDTVRILEGDPYFAEDYVQYGYVGNSLTLVFSKVLSDITLVSEVLAFTVPKAFSEEVTTTDLAVPTVGKGASDAVVAGDAVARSAAKSLVDTASPLEIFAARTTKPTSDGASLADVVALAPRVAIIDQPVASDSGLLVMQDYCDISYFAEDYVGVSRAFT